MALDKLVDSTQLDADLTTVADAIRTKGGTSAQLAFPNEMAQAVLDIPSGSGQNLWKYVTSLYQTFRNSAVTEVDIDFEDGHDINNSTGTFENCTQLEKIAIKNVNIYTSLNMRSSSLKTVELTNVTVNGLSIRDSQVEILDLTDCIVNGSMLYAFYNCEKLKRVIMNPNSKPTNIGAIFGFKNDALIDAGTWNLSVAHNSTNVLVQAPNCEFFGIVENTCIDSLQLQGTQLLTNASLVSIANGLSSASPATLTLSSTPKAKLSTIMGTVTDGKFTEDASGSTTLLNFITNVKGWTIA